MHTVHDAAVAGEDNGEREVAVADETCVFGDLTAGDPFCRVTVPVGFVEFADGRERDAFSRQSGRELDETSDVPGAEALG